MLASGSEATGAGRLSCEELMPLRSMTTSVRFASSWLVSKTASGDRPFDDWM